MNNLSLAELILKFLVFTGTNEIDFSSKREKLHSIVESESIDGLILFGNLFSSQEMRKVTKSKNNDTEKVKALIKKKQKQNVKGILGRNNQIDDVSSILSLNWLGIPVFVVPSPEDSKSNKIKRLQGQDTVFVRVLNNTSSLIKNWLIIGASDEGHVKNYLHLGNENTLFLYTAKEKNLFKKNLFRTGKINLLSVELINNKNKKSFLISTEAITDANEILVLDLSEKQSYSIFMNSVS